MKCYANIGTHYSRPWEGKESQRRLAFQVRPYRVYQQGTRTDERGGGGRRRRPCQRNTKQSKRRKLIIITIIKMYKTKESRTIINHFQSSASSSETSSSSSMVRVSIPIPTPASPPGGRTLTASNFSSEIIINSSIGFLGLASRNAD